MDIRQTIGLLVSKNLDSTEVKDLLVYFKYNSETDGDKTTFVIEKMIKAFVMQYFSSTATQKLLTYFDYHIEDGDVVGFLMEKVGQVAEEVKEDNTFEEERKMTEEISDF